MRVALAASRPAAATLARIGNSGVSRKGFSSTNALPCRRNDLFNRRIATDQYTPSTCHNSRILSAALKFP